MNKNLSLTHKNTPELTEKVNSGVVFWKNLYLYGYKENKVYILLIDNNSRKMYIWNKDMRGKVF